MRVRMRAQMSGTRNGRDWPRLGELLDLPDAEGADLCAAGLAEPVADEPAPERATAPPAETRRSK